MVVALQKVDTLTAVGSVVGSTGLILHASAHGLERTVVLLEKMGL